MNKTELEEELKKVKELLNKEKENVVFLLEQQSKYREMAEKAGSEAAAYKAMVTRLRDELERLDSTLNNLKRW